MNELVPQSIEELFRAVGDQLASAGATATIVVVGGASLLLHGWVERVTRDVDIIALARKQGEEYTLTPPDPLPPALTDAISRVARDFSLPRDWMNTVIGAQWMSGLPEGIDHDLTWRRYSALEVGIAGRRTLIALKLYACVDQGPESVHCQDLLALQPTDNELLETARWVMSQDESPAFPGMISEVIDYVRKHR